ncbi:MAG: ferrous iron transporter B [Oscillospiraceae bacterium]
METEQRRVIALAGNPNVGKSTLFNALTNLRQHTGNWPGKTVTSARGHYTHHGVLYEVVDLPGTYSLMAHSQEERVARDFLQTGGATCTVVLCDSTCLERNLILALQTIGLGGRVIVCVNLLDEAKRKGIAVDLAALEGELSVPVVGISAATGGGISRLLDVIAATAEIPAPEKSLLDPDEQRAAEQVGLAEKIARKVVTVRCGDGMARDRKLDRIFAGKYSGMAVLVLLLCGVLWLTIAGANVPSQWLARGFSWGQTQLTALFAALNAPDWLHGALVLGVYRVLAWVVSVMLPPMAIFFPLFTLLEDFGYLPRAAFLLDHFFQKAHACGKQALTMCMGLGCNAVGVEGARIIDSERERLVAIITNSLVPCNGRFPTLLTLAALFFVGTGGGLGGSLGTALALTAVILLGVAMTLWVSKLLTKTVLRGTPTAFTMELPPYRTPRFGQVVVRSVLDRTLFVLGRAVVVAAPAGLVIWVCANVTVGNASLLTHAIGFLDPFARLLGLDGVILAAFILGFPANEIVFPIILMGYLATGTLQDMEGAAALGSVLTQNGWTAVTALCTMLFSLFHWPCSTTCLTIWKETKSPKWTLLAVATPTAVGMVLCFAVATLARCFG